MFNSPQMQKALQSPAVSGQNLAAYQSPASPNPTVRSDDAKAEELRRAQMAQRAMGMQAAAMMGDPKQTPSILAAKEMENQQLRQMLAALQQRQQPAPQQMARGLESLPAPAMEKGYAGGGIVAFEDGGEVERYQSQGFVMPSRYKRTEFFDFFGRNERLGGSVAFDEEKLREDEQELARIKSGLESGSITNPATLGKLVALERDVQAGRSFLAQRNAPQTQAPSAAQRPPSVGDVAALGLDRGLPAAAAETRQRQQQSQGAGVAALRPAGQPVDASGIGMDFPSAERTPPSAGLLGEMQRMAAEGQAPSTTEPPVDSALARQKKILANRQALMKELGYEGSAGDEIRSQIEELKKSQEGYTKQAGLLGLAQALAAFGSAPRKQAAGAAAQAGAQFMTGQQEAKRKFETDMAALKASATRADRAEKRGDIEAVMKEDQFQETLRAEMDRLRAQIESREREGAADRSVKVSEGELDRQLNEKLTNAKIKAQVDLAKMDDTTKRWVASRPPETLRVIEGIASGGKMTFNEALDKFLTKGADNTAQLLKVWNEMSSSEKAKFGGNQAVFLATFGSGAIKAPSDVTVSERKQ